MTSDQAVELLRAAGEPTRMRILALLAREELAVLELTRILGQSQPRVSRHLKLLAEAGLVERFPDGAWVFYRLVGKGPARSLIDHALALISTPDLKLYLGSASSTIFGVIYVGGTLSCLVPLRFSRQSLPPAPGREPVLFLFLVVWAGDMFAYFAGRSMGRTQLFERVSPKKTVEGAMGGFAGSLLIAWGFARWFWQTADVKTVMLLGVLVAVAGQTGDLVESALKRCGEVKDSGGLLPGHGGLLDRIDSLIFGAPALWLALALKDLWRS